MHIVAALLAVVTAIVGDDRTVPCLSAGEPLKVDTTTIDLKGASYPDYRAWAYVFEMPSAIGVTRKGDLYFEPLYLRNVLDFVKPVKGKIPSELTLDTTGLAPGDYRVNVVINQRLNPFAFRIRLPEPSAAEWEGQLPLKWRIAHDDAAIRFSAVAGNDGPIVLFVDTVGDGRKVHRIVFRNDGTFTDALAQDDNTNTDTFMYDAKWRSRAKVSARRGQNAGWRLDATIPFGAFEDVETSAEKWGVAVAQTEKVTHPSDYPKRTFPNLQRKNHALDVVSVKARAVHGEKGLALDVCSTFRNRTAEFRLLKVRVSVETRDGTPLDVQERAIAVLPNRTTPLSCAVGAGKLADGDGVLVRVEAFSAEDMLERAYRKSERVTYSPVSLKMTWPYYRDCVFESMGLTELRGVALVEEGLGKPLTVTLEGPGTKDRVVIPSAAVSNVFRFAFRDKAKGDYFIRAGKAVKRIRNLPPREGEFWIDADKVMHRGREAIFPYGFYSEVYRDVYPGLNIAQQYNETMRTSEEISAAFRKAETNGLALIVSPFQNLSDVPFAKLFGTQAAQGEFDEAPYGEKRAESLQKFAAAARGERGVFAYFLSDEPEGRDLNPDFYRRAKEILEELDPYHPTMMVNCADRGARSFVESTDILSIDQYCVYRVGKDTIASRNEVYRRAKIAADLGVTAMFTPQVFDWDYYAPGDITRAPTYEEIRAQSLASIVANMKGLLLYSRVSMNPPTYHLSLGPELLAREIMESKDVFLAPSETVEVVTEPAEKHFCAALKRTKTSAALIAVNDSRHPLKVTFRSKNLPRRLYVGGEKTPVEVSGGAFTATFRPFEPVVWHSEPKSFSPSKALAEVEAAEASRRKPGNLAVASRFLTWVELKRMAKGKLDNGFPKITASSDNPKIMPDLPHGYFLQDGMATDFPYLAYHGWSPSKEDKAPSVTVDFGAKKPIRKVVVVCARTKGGAYPVSSVSLWANGREVAKGARGAEGRIVLDLGSCETSALVVKPVGSSSADECWLTEIEAY